MTTESQWPWGEDTADLIASLLSHSVRFIIVGAHALGAHGIVRATGDVDILVARSKEMSERIACALDDFGAPMQAHGVVQSDFEKAGLVYQIGLPPNRIDLLTSITAVEFSEAWDERVVVHLNGIAIPFLGKTHLIRNKLATGRPKDLLDVEMLRNHDRER
jgi:hypothetical protein